MHSGLQTNRFLPGSRVLAFDGERWVATTVVGRHANGAGFDINVDGEIRDVEGRRSSLDEK